MVTIIIAEHGWDEPPCVGTPAYNNFYGNGIVSAANAVE